MKRSALRHSSIVVAHLCILAFALVGCAQNEFSYRKNGIGADLYSADMQNATRNLETYFGYLCIRANIPTDAGLNEFLVDQQGTRSYPVCRYSQFSSNNGWNQLVQTGFNDIDRRCDGYLAWIEEVRNRERFGRSQLNAIGSLGNVIATAKNISTKTVGIIAEVFGFSRSLFDDYHELMYYGIESSTIKTIVMERRLDYRTEMSSVNVQHKANAENILRGYLRICMPTTITMDANTYARSRVTGSQLPSHIDAQTYRNTLVGASFKRDLPQNATDVVSASRVGEKDFIKGNNLSDVEEKLELSFGKRIQMNLCVSPTGFFGDETRKAIKIAKSLDQRLNPEAVTGRLESFQEANRFYVLKSCINGKYSHRNIFEALRYPSATEIKILANELQSCADEISAKPNVVGAPASVIGSESFTGDMRNMIAYIKQNHPNRNQFAAEPRAQLFPETIRLYEFCQ